MTEAEYRERLDVIETRISAVYRERRALMQEYAEEHPPPVMPPPRGRSDHQHRIARCPRCGGRLEDDRSAGQTAEPCSTTTTTGGTG